MCHLCSRGLWYDGSGFETTHTTHDAHNMNNMKKKLKTPWEEVVVAEYAVMMKATWITFFLPCRTPGLWTNNL